MRAGPQGPARLLSIRTLVRRSSFARRGPVRRLPLVEGIRLAFLVAASVGQLNQPEPMPLVEAAGADVLLEHPEPQPARTALLRQGKECRSDAAILRLGMDPEMPEHVLADCRERDEATALLGDPDVVVDEEQGADEIARLGLRVQVRQVGVGCTNSVVDWIPPDLQRDRIYAPYAVPESSSSRAACASSRDLANG